MGAKDHLIQLKKPKYKPDWMKQEEYDSAPQFITIRELKVKGKVLITTLLSPKATTRNELSALYKKRWHVEVDFRDIKTTLGMDILSCKSPAMIEKEIWTYFLAYNLIRLLMAQATLLADILPRQLSFKHAVQLWLMWGVQIQVVDAGLDEIILFNLIAQKTVGKRPGRMEPRALKKRELARISIEKYGHAKKLNLVPLGSDSIDSLCDLEYQVKPSVEDGVAFMYQQTILWILNSSHEARYCVIKQQQSDVYK